MQFERNFPVIGEKGKVPKEIQVPDTGYCYEKEVMIFPICQMKKARSI